MAVEREGVTTTPGPRLLILETSGRVGRVALAGGEKLLGVRSLDEARRHARDLAPAVKDLLAEAGWRPAAVEAVIVSRGPGSYTGLRVGLMSAKAFAYATGCAVLAIDTLAAIAEQAPADVLGVDVLADAQQNKVYVQRLARPAPAAPWSPASPLHIQPFPQWLAQRDEQTWVTGPGLRGHEPQLSGGRVVESRHWDPRPESLLRLGLERYRQGERDDLWTLEPLYLRPSSAEEQWQRKGK
jgi:tRNA threonylcarbamoyladenosine biosynthesis protein TsaB